MSRWDDLWNPPPTTPTGGAHLTVVTDPGTSTAYAAAALRSEAEQLATTGEGQRNDRLNVAAFRMGRHVGAGNIDAGTVIDTLAQAARATGLPQHEIDLVLRDRDDAALTQGATIPRHPEALPDQVVPAVTLLGDPPPPDPDAGADGEAAPEVASWAPLPLDDVLDGTYTPELPTVMPRDDGPCLLYPGRVHSFHGESESGKSLVAQAEGARLMAHGHDVLFIDFESDRAAVVGRLLELGATPDQLRHHFTYVRPEVDPRRFPHEQVAVAALLDHTYALAVIDGVTEALGVFGASTKDNDDITRWVRVLPRAVAALTGAAVVLVDHVTKDSEGRGRFAIGGQAKMAALDGAAYVVEVTEALGRGKRGMVTLRVAKDRPGGVRAHAGPFRATDRTQEAARVVVDSTHGDDLIHVTVGEPRSEDDATGGSSEWRPTKIMERVSRHLEEADEPLSRAVLEGLVGGNRDRVRQALAFLVRDHFAREETGPRGARLSRSIQPYREAQDRASDGYIPTPTTLTSPTSPDLAPTSPGRGGSDLAQPPAPPTGQGEVKQARSEGSPRPLPEGEVADEIQVACRTCFRPIEQRLARVTDGRCVKCKTTAGETPDTEETR